MNNIIKVAVAMIKIKLALLFISIILVGCKHVETEEESNTKNNNDLNAEEYLSVSESVLISHIQIDENNTLLYTLENNSESSYSLYEVTIEYFDGTQYCKVQEREGYKGAVQILNENGKLELSIDLNKRYFMTQKGKYRISVLIHNDSNEVNEMAVKDFDYD